MIRPRLLLLLTAALPALIITSCTKNPLPPVSTKDTTYGTLILRPDSSTGQDAYVSKVDDYPTDGGANLNWVPELTLARWTYSDFGQDSETQRSYIRFDSLAKLDTSALVLTATLYLYGETYSPSYPFGNSSYIGSYNPANTGLVERVIGGTWDQKTMTWNNAPALTSDGADTIAASTSQYNYNTSVDVTNLVKKMVASPSTNYGFGLRLVTEQLYRALEFSSCEAKDSTLRPKLVVSYRVIK